MTCYFLATVTSYMYCIKKSTNGGFLYNKSQDLIGYIEIPLC